MKRALTLFFLAALALLACEKEPLYTLHETSFGLQFRVDHSSGPAVGVLTWNKLRNYKYEDLEYTLTQNGEILMKSGVDTFYVFSTINPAVVGDFVLEAKKKRVTYGSASIRVNSDYVDIPDRGFEEALIKLGIDSDGAVDGRMQRADALSVDSLVLAHRFALGGIKNLTGIEAFENLEYLDCSGQAIEALNLEWNTKLKALYCGGVYSGGGGIYKQIGTIDVGSNRGFKILSFPFTGVSDIGFVHKQPDLEVLNLSFTNIKGLSLGMNPKLRKLYATGCVNLYSGNVDRVDLSKNTELEICDLFAHGLPTICVHSLDIDFDTAVLDTVPNGLATGNWIVSTTAWVKDTNTEYALCGE